MSFGRVQGFDMPCSCGSDTQHWLMFGKALGVIPRRSFTHVSGRQTGTADLLEGKGGRESTRGCPASKVDYERVAKELRPDPGLRPQDVRSWWSIALEVELNHELPRVLLPWAQGARCGWSSSAGCSAACAELPLL